MKMRVGPPLLEEPCAQTLSGKICPGTCGNMWKLHIIGTERKNINNSRSNVAMVTGNASTPRISNLESRVSILESRISSLGSRISDLGSRISSLGSRISSLGSRTSDLESRVSDLGSRIHTLRAWETPENRRKWYETVYEVEIPKRLKTLPAVDQRWRVCALAHLPQRSCKLK